MVERQLPKLNVAGSIPVSRSIYQLADPGFETNGLRLPREKRLPPPQLGDPYSPEIPTVKPNLPPQASPSFKAAQSDICGSPASRAVIIFAISPMGWRRR